MNLKKKRLGDILVDANLITEDQLNYALQMQKTTGKKLGEVLTEEEIVSEKEIIEVLELQLGIPHMDLNKFFINPEITKLIDEKVARRYNIIPISKSGNVITLAMSDPLNIFAIDDVKVITGLEVKPVISVAKDIESAIDNYYENETAKQALEEFKENYEVEDIDDLDQVMLDDINNAPVVKLVNSIVKQAIKMKASDIHIEPFEHFVRVRFRVDGDLQEIMTPAKTTHSAIVTRIKIMAKMDIVEKRIPQDGRIEMNMDGKEVDLRISVLPTVYGEKIVIRLLDRANFLFSKKQLGFSDVNLKRFDSIIKNPNGIILVTGPTGSGKSTTLYTVLKELNEMSKNIITVEDPVEYQLEGVNQVSVNTKVGLTFASGMRSILRQDPDIIMIGEIRDGETAEIAIRASITGHVVLSTMHTNDTASTVARLVDMDIEPYLVSSSVVGVTAQRLVKKVCECCKTEYKASIEQKMILGIDTTEDVLLYKGEGCNVCGDSGYKGRTGIHEIMIVDKDVRNLINEGSTIDSIRDINIKKGMITLKQNCVELALQGITTVDEVLRVAYSLE